MNALTLPPEKQSELRNALHAAQIEAELVDGLAPGGGRPAEHPDVIAADDLYLRAQSIYLALRAELPEDERAGFARLLAECARRLKLPELDARAAALFAPCARCHAERADHAERFPHALDDESGARLCAGWMAP